MTLKEFKPKYLMLEVIIKTGRKYSARLLHVNIAKYVYKDYEVVSVQDFEDTKTTSVVIRRKIKNDQSSKYRA